MFLDQARRLERLFQKAIRHGDPVLREDPGESVDAFVGGPIERNAGRLVERQEVHLASDAVKQPYEPEPEEEAPAEEAAAVATVTLGELYFRQGHYTEAERIFREVLEREPDNVAATAALHRLAALGPQPETPRLDARRLLTGYRRDPSQRADAEARSRKVFLLNRYLDRLRQGSAPDVS